MAKKTELLLDDLLDNMVIMYDRRDERNESRAHKRYLEGVTRSAAAVRSVIQHGTLDDCLAAVKSLLLHDLEFLARTDRQKKAVQQNIKNFSDALHNLDTLENRPDEYRRQAEGYIDDYKVAGGFPKDGMHGALRAYLGHLNARDSHYLTDIEADFLEVQKELAEEVTRRYTVMQGGLLGKK